MKNRVFFLAFLVKLALTSNLSGCHEYVYPVANLDDVFFLVMHQKSIDDISLLYWNKQDGTFFHCLPFTYLAYEVQILPSKDGFSFLDKGCLRIQYFYKRSPHTVRFNWAICNINNVTWLDNNSCMLNAQINNFFKTFVCTFNDQGSTLESIQNIDDQVDFLYSAKVNNYVFSIIKMNEMYDIIINDVELLTSTLLQCNQENPYCSLKMINEYLGFTLEIDPNQDRSSDLISFTYSQIKNHINHWEKTALFSFQIPADRILTYGPNRIFESLRPLIPVYTSEQIFFINTQQDKNNLALYSYSLQNGSINKILMPDFASADILLGVLSKNEIICGIGHASPQAPFYGLNLPTFAYQSLLGAAD